MFHGVKYLASWSERKCSKIGNRNMCKRNYFKPHLECVIQDCPSEKEVLLLTEMNPKEQIRL
jgi:hypothetical protein